MRLFRLRLANYRGIGTLDVAFAPTGITIIQGPNEAGKTSLGEAIRLLFEYPDSSKHKAIEAVRPVHRDEGPEIEIEAESGPYAFTYFKRFCKRPETRLVVTRPAPENHTGREAHDRAEAILRQTLDIDLWKALNLTQGDAIRQPEFSGRSWLSAALDRAAGGRPAECPEEGLFEKVRAEYLSYYTERGAERKCLGEARGALQQVQAEAEALEQALEDLNRDIELETTLSGELERLGVRRGEVRRELGALRATRKEITELEAALSEARLRLEKTRASHEAARRDKEARQKLARDLEEATKTEQSLRDSFAHARSALDRAQQEFERAEAGFVEAEKRRKEAADLAGLMRADFDYYTNRLHLDQLRERKERIDRVRKEAALAQEALATHKVDLAALKAIEEKERSLIAAKAQLEAGAPSVLLRGLSPGKCRLVLDGEDLVLAKGEVRELTVAHRAGLTVPGVVFIEISAGAGAEELSKKVAAAARALEETLRASGVETPEQAREAYEARREALRSIEAKEGVEKQNLRDLSYEELDQKLRALERSVPAYLERRSGLTPPLCADLEAARSEWERAEAALEEKSRQWESARSALEAARTLRDELAARYAEARTQLDLRAKDIELARERLERERETIADSELEERLEAARREAAAEGENVARIEALLRAKNPEKVRALLDSAEGSLETIDRQFAACDKQLAEVRTRLKIHGEEGLHERLALARMRLEHSRGEYQSLMRRARAARYLFEVMREERDRTRKAYVAPLKARIEQLGRVLFDETFEVALDEDLRVVSRTWKGVTVPFESLSSGAKEQISLIMRLACAMIVAADGGMPLVLDDALGNTDPARLRLMGAVLNRAAQECQILVFTCTPDRYSHVGAATVISLWGDAAAAGA